MTALFPNSKLTVGSRRTGNADGRRAGPGQLHGTSPRRAASCLDVAVCTALTTRDAHSGYRRTARLSDHVLGVDQQRTRLVYSMTTTNSITSDSSSHYLPPFLVSLLFPLPFSSLEEVMLDGDAHWHHLTNTVE